MIREAVGFAVIVAAVVAAVIRFVDWLNPNSGAVQAGAVAILVAVTAYYGWQARQQAKASADMARETREQMIRATEPKVALSDTGYSIKDVRVMLHNIGRGPALNIRCQVHHPAFAKSGERILLSSLNVGDTSRHTIDSDVGAPNFDGRATYEVLYEDIYGNHYVSRYNPESHKIEMARLF